MWTSGDSHTRPISLLPIAGKIFGILLYDRMFEFFIENNLVSKSQSGFRTGDSCINQLLSITHEIYLLMIALKSELCFRYMYGIW